MPPTITGVSIARWRSEDAFVIKWMILDCWRWSTNHSTWTTRASWTISVPQVGNWLGKLVTCTWGRPWLIGKQKRFVRWLSVFLGRDWCTDIMSNSGRQCFYAIFDWKHQLPTGFRLLKETVSMVFVHGPGMGATHRSDQQVYHICFSNCGNWRL